MRRREFSRCLGGAAALAARGARAAGRARAAHRRARCPQPRTMPEFQARLGAFLQGLAQLGWTIGRNVRIDIRWAASQCRPKFADTRRNWPRSRRTSSWPMAPRPWGRCCRRPAPCRSCSRIVADPVGAGFVDSLARPGGNATGFMTVRIRHEREMAGAAQADRAGRDASGGPSGSRPYPPGSASSAPSRPWRRRSGWR